MDGERSWHGRVTYWLVGVGLTVVGYLGGFSIGQPFFTVGLTMLALDSNRPLWLDVAMKRVGVAELKDELSKHLRAVEAGAVVEVTDRRRPIARIVPVPAGAPVTAQPPHRTFAAIRTRRYPPANWAVSSTDLLLRERQER